MKLLSVGKLARMFGISRTTLLYYDHIGLLCPSERSKTGYRLYNGDNLEKMSRIKLFRDAGIPLNEVSKLLGDKEKNRITAALLKQLNELNREIMAIKERQEVIVKILRSGKVVGSIRELDKEGWHEILRSAGIEVEASNKFHEDFEKHSPEQHQEFLKALGFDEEEIGSMRQRPIEG